MRKFLRGRINSLPQVREVRLRGLNANDRCLSALGFVFTLCSVVFIICAGATAAPRPPNPNTLICIDPGHSRATVGTQGKHLIEYQICWTVAKRLQAELLRRGYIVMLTKPDRDANIKNEDRARTANRAHAALLIRLHCDAGNEAGIATFYPNRQGVFGGVRGPSVEVIRKSGIAARRFHAALIHTLNGKLKDRGVRTDAQTAVGSKQGALTGSIYSQVPVILVEMAVLQQKHDEAFLASEAGQTLLTQAMADGVKEALK